MADLAYLRLVNGRLGADVKAGQVAGEGKAGEPERHVDAALVAAGDLTLTE